MNESPTQNNTYKDEKKATRYPYNGRSKYLIDKFLILGYEKETILKNLIYQELPINQNNNKSNEDDKSTQSLKEFEFNEFPSLINEISNDYSKEILDIDLIIEIIFPKKQIIYYKETNNNPKIKECYSNVVDVQSPSRDDSLISPISKKYNICEEEDDDEEFLPKSYNMVFSFNPQTENNSKKSINGFAYVFYKKFFNKNNIKVEKIYTLYIPTVFCIISEFPFYNSFYKLIRQIRYLFDSKSIEIPLEILIQNIVKYTISPLNTDVNLQLIKMDLINILKGDSSKINSINEEDEDNKLCDKSVAPTYKNKISRHNFNKGFILSKQNFERPKSPGTVKQMKSQTNIRNFGFRF